LYKADNRTVVTFVSMWAFFVTDLHEPFFTFTYWFSSTSSTDMELYMKPIEKLKNPVTHSHLVTSVRTAN